MDKFRKKARIILWIVLFGLVFWLSWMKIVPTGEITYTKTVSKDSDLIGKLTPESRVVQNSNKWKIVGNPAYFTLRVPRNFEKAKMTIKYKNPDKLALIEAGILTDDTLWRHKIEPLDNLLLNGLAGNWEAIKEDGILLLQKEVVYENIDDLLQDPPSSEKIAVYNYDLDIPYELLEYEPKEVSKELGGLRGDWQFFTYIKDEKLDMDFEFFDLNENDDPDDLELFLYYQGEVIDSRVFKDEGESDRTIKTSFELAGLPEGAYKVELRANNDIVTNKIKTIQQKLSFIGRVEFVRQGKPLKLYTNSQEFQVATENPDSLQKIEVIELYSPTSSFADVLDVNETYKQFSSKALSGVNQLNIEEDGIVLAGDGVFAFSPEALIDPRFKKAVFDPEIGRSEVEFIIAKYEFPDQYDHWNIATAEFDLRSAYQEDGKYGFMISVPGLRADDNVDDSLEIGEIRVDLEGRSLWDKAREIFNF